MNYYEFYYYEFIWRKKKSLMLMFLQILSLFFLTTSIYTTNVCVCVCDNS